LLNIAFQDFKPCIIQNSNRSHNILCLSYIAGSIYYHARAHHIHISTSQQYSNKKVQREMEKSKVLIVGGTGYIGKRLVKASLAQGHQTFVLHRPEIGVDIEKVQLLLSFKKKGARLVSGSFNDHQSLVNAVKLVDVVICAISGVHIRSHQILLQLKLVDAIKEAGNVKVIDLHVTKSPHIMHDSCNQMILVTLEIQINRPFNSL